jgi:hypothetical protein
MATQQLQTFVHETDDRKNSDKPFGYSSQNKKRSNATHKPNASCFTFYFAQPHQFFGSAIIFDNKYSVYLTIQINR